MSIPVYLALLIRLKIKRRRQRAGEIHDPDQPESRGALLVAPLGKGTYIYTTLSLVQQLPAAVPGAARLFINLLSAELEPVTGAYPQDSRRDVLQRNGSRRLVHPVFHQFQLRPVARWRQ